MQKLVISAQNELEKIKKSPKKVDRNFPNYSKVEAKVKLIPTVSNRVQANRNGFIFSPGYKTEPGPNRNQKRQMKKWDKGLPQRNRKSRIEADLEAGKQVHAKVVALRHERNRRRSSARKMAEKLAKQK